MSRPGGKKRGVKSFRNTSSPRKDRDHKCPPFPKEYEQFTTPEYTDDVGKARQNWHRYLLAVRRLEPNPRRTR